VAQSKLFRHDVLQAAPLHANGAQFVFPASMQPPIPLHELALSRVWLSMHAAAAHSVPDEYSWQVRLPLQLPVCPHVEGSW
jgi:hypothetical protein